MPGPCMALAAISIAVAVNDMSVMTSERITVNSLSVGAATLRDRDVRSGSDDQHRGEHHRADEGSGGSAEALEVNGHGVIPYM